MNQPRKNKPRRALFLDRDGIINVEKNYVYRVEDFEFIPGIFELCTSAQHLGFRLIVITNQAGIGRGYYSEADFYRLTAWMLERFRERAIQIDRVYHCPYHPTAGIGAYRRDSFNRKPNPGMLLQARDEFGLELPQCVLIGDKGSDIEAGREAGVGHLLLCCHSGQMQSLKRRDEPITVIDLQSAREWLISTFGTNCAEGLRLPGDE